MENVNKLKQETIFTSYDDPSKAWESLGMRKIVAEEYAEWLSSKQWDSFITLTFRDEVNPLWAGHQFSHLLQELNKELFGTHYSRIVGHSYFSYILGASNQKRGVLHYHLLTDRPVNFNLIKSKWFLWAGSARTENIRYSSRTVNYVTKVIEEGGEISVYKAKKVYIPKYSPRWLQ